MTTSQISLLALILVGGIGILLIGVSALMKAAARRKAKACTAVTMGTVIDHRFMGEGRMYPVLEYTVDGTQYRAKKTIPWHKDQKLVGTPHPHASHRLRRRQGLAARADRPHRPPRHPRGAALASR